MSVLIRGVEFTQREKEREREEEEEGQETHAFRCMLKHVQTK